MNRALSSAQFLDFPLTAVLVVSIYRKGIQNRKGDGGPDESNSVVTDANNNNDYCFHHITMTSEDLLQPGHIVKERWKVVSYFYLCTYNYYTHLP